MKFLAILLALAVTAGAAERQSLKHKHVPPAVASLTPIGNLEATNILHLSIGLTPRNQPQLESLLTDLYNPISPNYRRWLTNGEFANKFGPATNDYEAVASWAKSKGLRVSERYANNLVLSVEGKVQVVEKAFSVKLKKYRHPREPRDFYALSCEPTVDLKVSMANISGLENYSLPKPAIRLQPAFPGGATPNAPGSGPGGTYIGYDFRRAYLPGVANTAMTGTGQNVGLLEFDSCWYADLTSYKVAAGLPSTAYFVVNVLGGNPTPGVANAEVALDFDMVASMAPGCTVYFYDCYGQAPNWDAVLSAIATDNICKQISCSWNINFLYTDPTAVTLFAQMAVQGQSFFNSSGDCDSYYSVAAPFPCDCDNVTTVGGTALYMAGNGASWYSELAWNWGYYSPGCGNCAQSSCYTGTGGGVSTINPIPYYQTLVSMTANGGSTTMHNLPDVAAVAQNIFVIVNNGTTNTTGGTSAATPLWAAFCALANQQAAANSLPSVGFINPAIYAIGLGKGPTGYPYANCFHDVVVGNNFWPGSPSSYSAVAGYDLCTGWGSPAGVPLINALITTTKISLVFSNGLFIKATSP